MRKEVGTGLIVLGIMAYCYFFLVLVGSWA